ncbi:predicted protein [Naegleria gruberi]|uniref:Predicted protein n=1 Tax=Naegleria gruberi TaxID=5762 RepID=D2VKR6_NAEGR|nr:uncharacterized protein NAEGRDRAFT_50352 [Naegleria gruberi]EFC42740.1 predicted protein [Naegleria gruberi]|eukprot:XP_002675484.1 predicted protein [Naegleria gruberi strain NEG-M]
MQTSDEGNDDVLCFKSEKFLSKLSVLYEDYLMNTTPSSRELFLQAIRRGLSINILLNYLESLPSSHRTDEEEQDYSELISNDRELLMVAAQTGHSITEYISDELLVSDRELILTAVRNNFRNYIMLDDDLQNDKFVILEALKGTKIALNQLPFEVFSDREVMEACIGVELSGCLDYFNDDAREDRDLVLKCVRACGNDLNHASDLLRSDREIVLEAVKSNGGSLKFASQSLKSDKVIALEAMNNSLEAFPFISKDLKQDEEFINHCLDNFKITSLKGINDSLMKNRNVVMNLVRNGMSLSVTPEGFRCDREIVLTAVARRGSDLQFASDDLKMDEEIIRTAVKQNSSALEYAHESFQLNKEFVLDSIGSKDSENCYLHPDLTGNRDFVLEAIRKNGYLLHKTKFKDDFDMIIEACKSNPFSLFKLKLFQPGLFHNKSFALQVVAISGPLLQLFDERIKRDKEVVLTALEHDENLFNIHGISSLTSISPELIKDREFMSEVVELIRRKRF